MEGSVFALRDALVDAGTRGQALSDYVIATRGSLSEATGKLATLHGGLEEKSLQQRAG